ncbi:hypothetical protein [Gallaecimonas pentaromativorans]|uniref:hypothetical protein n=1 Tax=Gallaecimonas pentaromativorans TaxID=584787 RepID=UPI003A90CDAD
MNAENGYNLVSVCFADSVLRTDGHMVNCQYGAGPWERWQFLPASRAPSYYLQSVQFLGRYLCVLGDNLGMTSSELEATSFTLVCCDPDNPSLLALQGPNGDYLAITSGMVAPYGPGGGKVQMSPFSELAVLRLQIAQPSA